MLRTEFVEAIDVVIHAVFDADIPAAIQAALRPVNHNTKFKAIFDAQAKFKEHYQSFSEAEIEVLRALNWLQFAESEFWSDMLANNKSKERNQRLPDDILTVATVLPQVARLVEQEKDDLNKEVGASLSLVINDPANKTLSVADLAEILHAINDLYVLISRVFEPDSGRLLVSAIDSGSPISLMIGGGKIAIAAMKSFIQKNHERLFFFQAAKARANFQAASDGIDLLAKLKELELSGGISKSSAAAIRRRAEKNVRILLENGVHVPGTFNANEPKKIEHQPTRLLTHAKPPPDVEPS